MQPTPQHKLYVGNLNFEATEAQVRELFSVFGSVLEVKIVMDRFSGKSRGFAFVSFESGDAARKAKETLHSQPYQGKTLTIDFAREEQREPRVAGSVERRERPASSGFGAPRREWNSNSRDHDRRNTRNDRDGYRGDSDRGNNRYSR